MAYTWMAKQKYLKGFCLLILLFPISCNTESKSKRIPAHSAVKKIEYIKVEFRDLKRILELDSTEADKLIRSLGFDSDSSSFVYAHSSFLKSRLYDSTLKLGIGHYFLKNYPVLVYSQPFLIYTFPINQLYYYKASILKDNWSYDYKKQDISYNPTFEITYPQEFYKIEGIYGEFNLDVNYYKEYASISMRYYKN